METTIQKDNKKALPKYLLIITASMLLGGVAGFFSVSLADGGSAAGFVPWLQQWVRPIMPFLLPAMILALVIYYGVVTKKLRKVHSTWDGEDEEISDWLDRTLDDLSTVVNCSMPLGYFLFSMNFCWADLLHPGYMLVNAAFLLTYLGVTSYLQMRTVNFVRVINPEKQGSVFDPKFWKKWQDSCDEAEKKQIGEASLSVFRVMNTAYAISFAVLIFLHVLFSTGLLPIFVVMLLWFVSFLTYGIKAHQLKTDKK